MIVHGSIDTFHKNFDKNSEPRAGHRSRIGDGVQTSPPQMRTTRAYATVPERRVPRRTSPADADRQTWRAACAHSREECPAAPRFTAGGWSGWVASSAP